MMRWRTGNHRRKGKAFQARLRRPLAPIVANGDGGWTMPVRVILTPGMPKAAHVFADAARPFPLAAVEEGQG